VNVLLDRRRALRRESTDAEAVLWTELRAKRFGGFKFRRQHPCGPYILDFYCARRRLVVELDGGQHYEAQAQAYDERRTGYLRRHGIVVLRFPTNLVFMERAGLLDAIARALGIAGPSP
jgi:very-short-patch-repair endonuclease